MGILLVFLGAFCDGVYSRNQTGIRKTYSPEPYQFMFITCVWVFVISLVWGFLSGENLAMVKFFMEDPESFTDQLQLSSLNVLGQMFIFLTISWVGPIYLSLFTTTRKIFSVLCSIIIHGHSIDFWRASGIATVSFGILLDAGLSIRNKTKGKKIKTK